MKNIANLLFEAKILKDIPRSGFHFLGTGKESVAEHSHITTFIVYVMSCLHPEADTLKMLKMCLVHDLPEARIGDINYVQKTYVKADEEKAIKDMSRDLPFKPEFEKLIKEFNEGKTFESRLARDADQLALILDLKRLIDSGHEPPVQWMPAVTDRLVTETGKAMAEEIKKTKSDAWWRKIFID
ncbi:MAG: HD domain-containing protein [Desulfobacterales bacterium]|nr:HD domain-containing protein [Desulfobacterales bacterium]